MVLCVGGRCMGAKKVFLRVSLGCRECNILSQFNHKYAETPWTFLNGTTHRHISSSTHLVLTISWNDSNSTGWFTFLQYSFHFWKRKTKKKAVDLWTVQSTLDSTPHTSSRSDQISFFINIPPFFYIPTILPASFLSSFWVREEL